MANKWPGTALREFQTLFGGGVPSALTDQQLLERFAGRHNEEAEAAFAALIGRHGPMVWGVCHRVLHDPADAGDAFQATFLVLVRRAGSVRVGDSLGPWLYGVSIRVARRARVVAIRHRRRERTGTNPPDPLGRDAGPGDDLRAVIDEELDRLPSRYRSAIVACHLEGLTHEEAASRLSCPVGTVRSRLARGRDLLRSRLTARGLAPGVAAITAALAPESARSPGLESLFTSTARSAARLAAGHSLAGAVSAGALALVAGVTRNMMLTRIGWGASILAVSLIAAAAAALAGQGAGGRRPEAAKPTVAVALAPNDGGPSAEVAFAAYPAVVLKTVPPTNAIDVDPDLTEIRATFNKEMSDGSWSWVHNSKETFPEVVGKPRYAEDKRTCILTVKLEPSKTYAVWLNSPRFGNFRDVAGQSAVPYLLLFRTRAKYTPLPKNG